MRARLTLVVFTATVVAIVVALVTAYRSVSPLVADQVDRSLTDRAETVAAILGAAETSPGGSASVASKLPVRTDMIEQLLLPDGTVLALTPGRDPLPVSESDRDIARAGTGSAETDITVGGVSYGVLTTARPGGGAIMVGQNYAEVERVDREFLWRTASITAVAVLLVAVVGWLAIGRILRPMRRLAQATQRITTTRDLSTVLPDAGRDEVGDLTRDFNAMLAALRLSRAQQHRLVQDAGHELRTPLTSVRGSAELLQRARGRLEPADEAQVLTTLVQEAKALDALIGELVELATDQYTDESPVPVALPDLAEACAQRFRRRTGRVISLRITDTPVREGDTATVASTEVALTARPRALARCVDNLLDNAIKFSAPDTEVEVRVCGTELAVLDRGPGIDAADQRAVFDRFYRADRTRSTPGSGLGLAIVHDIITAHAGTVFAADRPGGGAEVGFRLPGTGPRAS
ncbi:HAMP domain-containing sensor histidine kinase [Nocardia sp. CDC153]|uniref:HAMP domain-containing sensor histidine kinase n=1 Tax=Nocardia sp. CDC153 TaxID=3112167 RepID=UPI002DBEB425|nr:HAMP domain-containing sensor histidine kinase [Nocardia sp. CDC153]MEC3952936.1 HAMP domain-containing sensor histidine kinase [Nocardia sp. CDC153]